MSHYLQYKFEDSRAFVSTFDEAPLWSAAFGLMLLKYLPVTNLRHVVDVGCGTGFPLFELAGRLGNDVKITGVDTWENALQRASEKRNNYGYANIELVLASADAMPLADGSADLIVSNLGINNFAQPEKVLAECYRVLTDKGRIAITTNIDGHWKLFYDIFDCVLEESGDHACRESLRDQQRHRGSKESIANLFTTSGFTVIRMAEEEMETKFADGSAFLNHHFVRLGWLSSWLELIPVEKQQTIFSALEVTLNNYAASAGGLSLTVPMLFVEGQKT